MTTAMIARRANARAASSGWVARCPAHADRSPSLSIREGRDGRTLLRCFAGCESTAIVRALGLSIADLFETYRPVCSLRQRALTADDVEASLQSELVRIVAEESERVGFDIAVLMRHRNAARAIVERRLSVQLMREIPLWWEVEPHCADPAWASCIDQALSVAAACRDVSLETLRASIGDLPKMQERVLHYARRLQRSLAKESTSHQECAA